MKSLDVFENIEQSDTPDHRVVVRLATEAWACKRGLNRIKRLRILRRQCSGHNFLEEEISQVGADEAMAMIINLDECDDGVYEVITVNESRDWESGIIDSYEFKLVPYTETTTESA